MTLNIKNTCSPSIDRGLKVVSIAHWFRALTRFVKGPGDHTKIPAKQTFLISISNIIKYKKLKMLSFIISCEISFHYIAVNWAVQIIFFPTYFTSQRYSFNEVVSEYVKKKTLQISYYFIFISFMSYFENCYENLKGILKYLYKK